jgi:hypothetical protein
MLTFFPSLNSFFLIYEGINTIICGVKKNENEIKQENKYE